MDKQELTQLLQQVAYILVVDIERTAIDIGPFRQLPHGDGAGGLLCHQVHQCLPKLPLRLFYATVYGHILHVPLPPPARSPAVFQTFYHIFCRKSNAFRKNVLHFLRRV